MAERVGVVILNWRRSHETITCVESVLASGYSNLHPIIVDNDSGDGSGARLEAAFPRLTVLRTGANLGYGGGNNRGIERAMAEGAEYVFVLNNDTEIEAGCIGRLVAACRRDVRIAQVGPKVLDTRLGRIGAVGGEVRWKVAEPRQIGHSERDVGQFSRVEDVDYVPGTAVLVRSEAIRQVGPLPEDYFLYFEDVVWSWRFRQSGWRTIVEPSAVVHHGESTTTGPDSPLKRYYAVRNNLYFIDECVPPAAAPMVRWRFRVKLAKGASRALLGGRIRQVRAMWSGYRDYGARLRGEAPRLPG